mgnify:CR=1 FL=1|jgi:hypothetical protein
MSGSDKMFKDDEMGLDIYIKYDGLVKLFKDKRAASSKLTELEYVLQYFNESYDKFNKEEKKLIRNVVMIAEGIINKVNNNYNYVQERINNCITLVNEIKDKQKELVK